MKEPKPKKDLRLKDKKELYLRDVFTAPYGKTIPAKYQGYDIPRQFTATFYLLDNDNVKVTEENKGTFHTWQAVLYIKITKAETVEVVRTEIAGARAYKGHSIILIGEPDDPFTYGTIQARHYTALRDYRTRMVSVAVQSAIQTHKFSKNPEGNYQVTLGDKVEISRAELERIDRIVSETTYSKLDDTFYRRVADIYNQAVREGERFPTEVVRKELDKKQSTVQGYVKKCRDMKLILPAKEPGKPSQAINTPTKGKKGK